MSHTPPSQTYYVVMPPQPPDVGGAIRPIARLLEEEEGTVRAKLASGAMTVLRRYAKRANAEGLVGQLQAFGIRTIILSDSGVRGHLFLWAKAASRGQGGFAFRDFGDQPLYCPFDDVVSVTVMKVIRFDESVTHLVDLHRRSTPIVPRLDMVLFDLPALLNKQNARLDDFLAELEQHADLKVDRNFERHRHLLSALADDFASAPSEFLPPAEGLPSPYAKTDLLVANLYSVCLRALMTGGTN